MVCSVLWKVCEIAPRVKKGRKQICLLHRLYSGRWRSNVLIFHARARRSHASA